jgi:hypothetical protein
MASPRFAPLSPTAEPKLRQESSLIENWQFQDQNLNGHPFAIFRLIRSHPNFRVVPQIIRGAADSLGGGNTATKVYLTFLYVDPTQVAASSRNVNVLSSLVLGALHNPALKDSSDSQYGQGEA